MPSEVDVANMALDQIGSTVTVQSINPPAPSGVVAETLARNWTTWLSSTFRGAHWNCLRFQKPLTLLKSAAGTQSNPSGSGPLPPIPFLYEYAYPTDCALMRFVIPQVTTPGTSVPIMTNVGGLTVNNAITRIPFVPALDEDAQGKPIKVILTNAPVALGCYTRYLPDPNFWDDSLLQAVICVVAAWMVNPAARNKDLLQERVGMARSMIEEARRTNGNEGISNIDHYPDFMQVRDGGGWNDYETLGLATMYAGPAGVALPGLTY